MAINITFGGATIARPGAYSTVDSSNMIPVSTGSFKTLAFVGVPGTPVAGATAPVAGTVSYFNDPAQASKAIGASDLLDCMNIAWQHGADLIGVSIVGMTTGETAPSSTDWQNAVNALQTEDVDGIVAVTSTSANWTMFDTHVTTMSNTTNKKERRAFYGHATGLAKIGDVTGVTSLMTSLTDERAVMASPGVQYPDNTGTLVVKPSYYLASAYAGLWAGQNPQEPITYKNVKFQGLEVKLMPTDITNLLKAGVAPTEYKKGVGFRVVQGVTAVNGSATDLTQCELSVSTLKDVMSTSLRDFLATKYVGKAGVAGITVTMYNDVISMLEQFLKNNWISAYDKTTVSVTQNGTTFSVAWSGTPTLPINDFLITSHFTL